MKTKALLELFGIAGLLLGTACLFLGESPEQQAIAQKTTQRKTSKNPRQVRTSKLHNCAQPHHQGPCKVDPKLEEVTRAAQDSQAPQGSQQTAAPSQDRDLSKQPRHGAMIVVGLAELVKGADQIVEGRVIDAKAHYDDEQHMIFTTYTVEIAQAFKGPKADRTVSFRVLGGEVAGIGRMNVAHAPDIGLGSQGYFFIDKNPTLWTQLVADQGFVQIDTSQPDATGLLDGFGRTIHGLSDQGDFEAQGPELFLKDELVSAVKTYVADSDD